MFHFVDEIKTRKYQLIANDDVECVSERMTDKIDNFNQSRVPRMSVSPLFICFGS